MKHWVDINLCGNFKIIIMYLFFSKLCFSFQVFFSEKDFLYYNSVNKKIANGLVILEKFPNGKIKEEMYLSNGEISGIKSYYSNGEIKENYSRRNGVYSETFVKKYYTNGNMSEEIIYDEWNLEPRLYVSYFESAQKKIEIHFFGNGDKSRKWEYNELGELDKITRYYEHPKHARVLKKDEEIIKVSNVLNNQIKIMKIHAENNSQQLESEVFYKNNKLDGTHKEYYENGILRREKIYNNGSKIGIWKSYYDDGKVSTIESYENGLESGTWYAYDEYGVKRFEAYYGNGKAIGIWKRYYSNGEKRQETHYENNEIKRTVFFKPNGNKTTKREMLRLNYELESQ